MTERILRLGWLVGSCTLATVVGASAVYLAQLGGLPPGFLQPEANKLETDYFSFDFQRAEADGVQFLSSSTAKRDPEVIAWLALNEARADDVNEAKSLASRLAADDPTTPWASFAVAGALIHDKDEQRALQESARALAENPHKQEFVWLRAETLRLRHRFAEALELIRGRGGSLSSQSYLFDDLRGSILFDEAIERNYPEAEVHLALNYFKIAQANKPNVAMSYYLPGWYLKNARRVDEAVGYLRRAAQLSLAPDVHSVYWSAVQEDPSILPWDQRKLIESDLSRILKPVDETPQLLMRASSMYIKLGELAAAQRTFARLIHAFPDSREAASAEIENIRTIHGSNILGEAAVALAPGTKARLLHFGLTHQLDNTPYTEEALSLLIELLQRDPNTTAAEALVAADAMVARAPMGHFAYGRAAQLVARRGDPKAARSLAMQGIARIGDLVKIDTIPDDKARAQYQRSYLGQLYDAFGWAAVRQGEYPEASTALHHAYSLDPYSIQAMQDLGRYSEHMKNIPDAETWYIRCATTPTLSVNPCAGSLSQLYRRSHGNMEGFDSHLVELSSRMALERRSRIEKTEIIRGPPVSFNLTDIHGIKYSSSDYRGKIVVLSFWALWCDICRVHLPKLNRLAGPYRANSDVVILTINDGSDLPEARKWAELQGITLPILDGKDFIKKQGIASVPTTWFLDKEGRKVLEVVGLEASMDDEFNARIDMLRSEGRTAGPDMVR